MSVNKYIKRHHHLTLSVGNGQEDYDFHTKILGLKSVKKTAHALVVYPAKATFTRPVGDFTMLED